MSLSWISVLMALLAGVSVVVQQAMNANLRITLNSPALSGFVSYGIGVICMMLFAIASRDPLPDIATISRLPFWAWSGGLFGAIFIGLSIILVPRLGVATFIGLLITGQMLTSLAFDQFGWLGVPQRPIDLSRICGAALLIVGVTLVKI